MDMELPDWLQPPENVERSAPPKATLTSAERNLEQQTFGIAFEYLLEHLSNAETFTGFCLRYRDPFNKPLSAARFRTWIFANAARRQAYYGAKILAAEAIEDDLIRIADGIGPDGAPSPIDPQRAKLMVETRWKLLPVYNRERYSPSSSVDVTSNVQTTVTLKTIEQASTTDLKRLILEKLGRLADPSTATSLDLAASFPHDDTDTSDPP